MYLEAYQINYTIIPTISFISCQYKILTILDLSQLYMSNKFKIKWHFIAIWKSCDIKAETLWRNNVWKTTIIRSILFHKMLILFCSNADDTLNDSLKL